MKKFQMSEQLKTKLKEISQYPVTIMDAPQGYGKTLSLQTYLEQQKQAGAFVAWYTCMGESAAYTWEQICEMFVAAGLWKEGTRKNSETPDLDVMIHMITMLRQVSCDTQTYLVIDNYQFVQFSYSYEVIRAFSMHGCTNLHLVFLTRSIDAQKRGYLYTREIFRIGPDDFLLNRTAVSALFRSGGLRISEDHLNDVMRITEGCPAAVDCMAACYRDTGTTDCHESLELLIEHTIWESLRESERQLFMQVSLLEWFDAAQAAELIGCSSLSQDNADLLRHHALVRFDAKTNTYQLFYLLRQYALRRIRSFMPERYYREKILAAAKSCAKRRRFLEAAQLYLSVGDYETVLSLPLDNQYLCEQKIHQVIALMEEVLRQCPRKTMVLYPRAMINIALFMLFDLQFVRYHTLLKSIQCSLESNSAGLEPKELNRLQAEYLLLDSLTKVKDMQAMGEQWKKVYAMLKAPSEILSAAMPSNCGASSLVYLFWRESGKLISSTQMCCTYLPYYNKLTGNSIVGADSALYAEAMLFQGNDEQAEIHCYKSIYIAKSEGRELVCICAEQVLARIAILRGDVAGFFRAVNQIKYYLSPDWNENTRLTAQLGLGIIQCVLGIFSEEKNLYFRGTYEQELVFRSALPYAQIIQAGQLLHEQKYSRLLGAAESFMQHAKELSCILPQIYYYNYLAAAYRQTGQSEKAYACLREAIRLAAADQAYLLIAVHGSSVRMLNEMTSAEHEALRDEQSDVDRHIKEIRRLYYKQLAGAAVIHNAINREKSPLTPREREVALLAKQRLSAKEIAEKLYISEKTVRTILRNVYGKLEVHSRAELVEKEI